MNHFGGEEGGDGDEDEDASCSPSAAPPAGAGRFSGELCGGAVKARCGCPFMFLFFFHAWYEAANLTIEILLLPCRGPSSGASPVVFFAVGRCGALW